MERIIHQIWVGKYRMPAREQGYVQRMKELNPNCHHYLWTDENMPKLPANIQGIYDYYEGLQDYALQADLLRIFIVALYGGFYIDVDFDPHAPIYDNVFSSDIVLFHHDEADYTIPNNIFGARSGHPILVSMYEGMHRDKGVWYGPSGFGERIKTYFGLPYLTCQQSVRDKVEAIGGQFRSYGDFARDCALHRSLYSWCPEQKNMFKRGDYV